MWALVTQVSRRGPAVLTQIELCHEEYTKTNTTRDVGTDLLLAKVDAHIAQALALSRI